VNLREIGYEDVNHFHMAEDRVHWQTSEYENEI